MQWRDLYQLISFRVQIRQMFNKKHILAAVVLLSILSIGLGEDLAIKNVERQVLLNGPYPMEQVFIQFKSEGNVNIFKHIVPAELQQRVKVIVFSKSKQGRQPFPYTREQYIYDGQKYTLYKVELDRSYYSDEEGQLYIITAYLNRYINFPAEITMNEDQKFELEDNKYFLSVYPVQSQSSTYKFDKFIKYDKDGEAKGINTVVFKKQNAEPFTVQNHIIHGVNNDPQIYFTNVERIIEVSHWGNIAITQFYSLKNVGPALKGQFSRVTYGSQEHVNVKNAFKGIEAQLPTEVWGLYYRDEVGNISTSRAYRDEYQNKVKFALVPRFSLLGQWKCNWEVGYNLPTEGYLYKDAGNKFQLDNIDLEYTLEKIVAQNYEFKIILPEGASNVKARVGDKQLIPTRIEKSFGFLDFFGRPTYVFENYRDPLKKRQIKVDYELDTLSTLYKPIVLFVIIFSLLAVVIVSKRLRLEAFNEEKSQ